MDSGGASSWLDARVDQFGSVGLRRSRGWILQGVKLLAGALGAEDDDAGIWIEIQEDDVGTTNVVIQLNRDRDVILPLFTWSEIPPNVLHFCTEGVFWQGSPTMAS
jgi:hypothetical protein